MSAIQNELPFRKTYFAIGTNYLGENRLKIRYRNSEGKTNLEFTADLEFQDSVQNS